MLPGTTLYTVDEMVLYRISIKKSVLNQEKAPVVPSVASKKQVDTALGDMV